MNKLHYNSLTRKPLDYDSKMLHELLDGRMIEFHRISTHQLICHTPRRTIPRCRRYYTCNFE